MTISHNRLYTPRQLEGQCDKKKMCRFVPYGACYYTRVRHNILYFFFLSYRPHVYNNLLEVVEIGSTVRNDVAFVHDRTTRMTTIKIIFIFFLSKTVVRTTTVTAM